MTIERLKWGADGALFFNRNRTGEAGWEPVEGRLSDLPDEPEETIPVVPGPPASPTRRALFAHLDMNDGSQLQGVFLLGVGLLIQHINATGRYVTAGDFFRDARAFGALGVRGPYGSASSYHKLRLAADLNLFTLAPDTYHGSGTGMEMHEPYGVWWEQLGQDIGAPFRWGGRYGDPNHYEAAKGWEWTPL